MRCIVSYMRSYTGAWFSQLAGPDPTRISTADLAAVTTLGVDVPAGVAIWLLQPDNQDEIARLLRGIPNLSIASAPRAILEPGSPADELWQLLKSRRWPEGAVLRNGLGPVTAGKLLAAKRPELIPIWDHWVDEALVPPRRQFWESMWEQFQDDRFGAELRAVRDAALSACRTEDVIVPAQPSLLRTLDIVVWMRFYGCLHSPDAEVRALSAKDVGSP